MVIYTILSFCWRVAIYLCDWRAVARKLANRSSVDTIFIPNLRDEDKIRYLGGWNPSGGHADGLHLWQKGISARTRAINTTTSELATEAGRSKAKKQFISACEWAKNKGVRVVLLAAGTKHLFNNGQKLKELFPNLIFTIGDNGTVLLLCEETLRAFSKAGLKPKNSRIGILGPYGILGKMMTKILSDKGYDIIGVGPNILALKRVAEEFSIEICKSFSQMGKVDAVVACTHSERIRLNSQYVELLRRPGKKLLLLDVAEPSNLKYREYQKCKQVVIRQDAGNAYSRKLKYVLGGISYRMFGLTKGVTFGCFAEAISLAAALKRGEDIQSIDWFDINETNMAIMAKMFEKDSFGLPTPRCFGSPVKSFDLNLLSGPESTRVPKSSWKLAFEKIMSLLF